MPGLIPGRYSVGAEKSGFRKSTIPEITVEVNQTLRIDIPMTVGQVVEEVRVTEAPPLVQTDTSMLGQVVNNRGVSELPLNGRDFTNLLRLNSGVTEV